MVFFLTYNDQHCKDHIKILIKEQVKSFFKLFKYETHSMICDENANKKYNLFQLIKNWTP